MGLRLGGSGLLSGVTIANNSAARLNGGLLISSGAMVTIADSTISNNSTRFGAAGGLRNLGTTTLIRTTIDGNSAVNVGFNSVEGGGVLNGGTLGIYNSTISNNYVDAASDARGGGIYNSGSLTLTNTTLFRNGVDASISSLHQGGGIFNASGATATILHSTITGNYIDPEGGGAPLGTGGGIFSDGTLTLANSIVAGNRATNSTTNDLGGTGTMTFTGVNVFATAGTGDAQDIVETNLNNVFDSLVTINGFSAGALANNGGPVQTVLIKSLGVANNTGDNNAIPIDLRDLDGDSDTAEVLPVDARGVGFARVRNGQADIGAVEVQRLLQKIERQAPISEQTQNDSLVFRVTFGDPVSGVDAADFVVTGTTATITQVTPVNSAVYDITVSGGNLAELDGVVGLDLSGSQNIVDSNGVGMPTVEPAIDQTYTLAHGPVPALTEIQFQTTYDRISWFDQIAGTSTDPAGVASTEIGVWSRSNSFYWDGTGFGSSTPAFHATNGTPENWVLSFPIDNFAPGGNFSVAVRTTDSLGNVNVTSFGSQDFFFVDTTLIVDQLLDESDGNYEPGDVSLREAIEQADLLPGHNNIRFSSSLAGGTITLGSELALTSDIRIDGDSNGDEKADITISGNNASRIFNISGSGTDVALHSLTLENGSVIGAGGAISLGSGATLELVNSTVRNSTAFSNGGGIYNHGVLNVANSTISGNNSSYSGGGIYSNNGTATLTNTTIHDNTSQTFGRGIVNAFGSLTLNNSTVTSNNTGTMGGGGLEVFNGTVTVNNSVIAENMSGGVADDFFENTAGGAAATINVNNSFFGTDEEAAFDTNANNINNGGSPGLDALADNGGPVQTRAIQAGSALLDAGADSLLPTETSLGIDVDGDGTIESTVITIDARGTNRSGGSSVDIGAFEIHAPVFTSPTTANVAENMQAVHQLTATDADLPAQTITFSLAGSGADNNLFEVVNGNQLQFIAAPDFEIPTDANADNIYEVSVLANDGNGGVTPQTILVTVNPVNDNVPVFTSPATANVAENTQAVHTLTATDADLPAQTITFDGVGGPDGHLFEIVNGNQLQFKVAPDFEAPTDLGGTVGDNIYEISIGASDDSLGFGFQDIQVTVDPVNDNVPVFTSPATANVAENTQAVHALTATDGDLPAQTITFSILGLAPAGDLGPGQTLTSDQSIQSPDGSHTFVFQSDGNFVVYGPGGVVTWASGTNGTGADSATIESNGNLVIRNGATTVYQTNSASDPNSLARLHLTNDGQPVIFRVDGAKLWEATLGTTGGTVFTPGALDSSFTAAADNSQFEVVGGALQFITAPDFENPTDLAGTAGDNIYEVSVLADDGNGGVTPQTILVTVTDVDEIAPTADIVDVTPDPRNTAVGSVTINFDEAVANVDITDFTLTRDGAAVDISSLTINQIDPQQYEVDLSTVTGADGDYVLTLLQASDVVDAAGNALSADASDVFSVDTVAAQVESIDIQDGSGQRSVIREITVNFDSIVTADSGAFVLTNSSGQMVDVTATLTVVEGKTRAVLTFSGTLTDSTGSLIDGQYSLRIVDSLIHDQAGNALDADGDGTSGDDLTDDFFRLYGDADGDGSVGFFDYALFRAALFAMEGDDNFNIAFDANGDGEINLLDIQAFRDNFGTSIGK